MATYYVGAGGSDAAAGTSYANRWLTVSKAIGATAAAASGDTVYFTPGTYREFISLGGTWTSDVLVIGDVDGSHTSGAPGPVVFTAYTNGDTNAPPSATILLNTNAKNHVSFSNITFIGGTGQCLYVEWNSTFFTFTDCTLINIRTEGEGQVVSVDNPAQTIKNLTFNRCRIYGYAPVSMNLEGDSGAAYDPLIIFTNCVIVAWRYTGCRFGGGTASAGKPGGVKFRNCTIIAGGEHCIYINSTGYSTANPMTVNNCLLISHQAALNSGAASQMTENYCLLQVAESTKRTNVTAGANSISDGSYSVATMHLGQEAADGQYLRSHYSPWAGSPLLGFGSTGTPPTVDILNRPRPAGGSIVYAVGAFERHDTAAKETGTTDAGGVGIVITGPGDQDLQIPVDATSTTITVRARWDTLHATTNKPQAQLLANGEIGYAGQTLTMAAAVDTWETLTFTAFTPTAKGVVTLRLISRSAATTGKAFFDTVTAT